MDDDTHARDSDAGLFDERVIWHTLNENQLGDRNDSPEHNLIVAIFRQAVADIREGRSNARDGYMFFNRANPNFRFYCNLLSLSPDLVINSSKQYLVKINSRLKKGKLCNVHVAIT